MTNHERRLKLPPRTPVQSPDELRRRAETFSYLVHLAREGIWAVDSNAKTTFVNQRMGEMLGCSSESLLGKPLSDFTDEAGKNRLKILLERRRAGISEQLEFQFVRADGKLVDTLLSTAPFLDDQGRFSGAVALITDVTEQKRTERELRLSEEMFRQSFFNNPLGTALMSPELRVARCNRIFAEMLEYNEREIIGKHVSELTVPEDREQDGARLQGLFEGQQAGFEIEKHYLTRTGRRIWAQLSTSVIRDPSGNVIYALGMAQNIEERRRHAQERERLLAEEHQARVEAQEAIQIRDDFLSLASHELKTPLTPVRINIETLIRLSQRGDLERLESQRRERILQNTYQQLIRLTKLVEELLDVSRIRVGKIEIQPEAVSLPELALNVCRRFESSFSATGTPLTLDLPQSLPGRWDPSRLEQILENLITNALKYGRGKPISLSVSRSPSGAEIRVRDHGPGVPESERARIFERFVRLASREHIPGLGLGLYITRQLVQAHGGTIHVESAPGQGATFVVRLPLDSVRPEPAKAA